MYIWTKHRYTQHTAPANVGRVRAKGVLPSDSKGPRWIIDHASGEMGFIPNAQLIFKSQSNSGDYHDEINKVNTKWLQEKLLPNLPLRSIVVMDNASYHALWVNKAPTKHKK